LTDAAPQRDETLAALHRVLAWPEIARSPQLGRFLDYIVHRKVDGQEGSIKAYSIAVDVLGRGADFDPQVDPIVRVQARRLRGLLDRYYEGPGQDDTVRIALPVGRYVPEFTWRLPEIQPAESVSAQPVPIRKGFGFASSWMLLLALMVGVGMSAFLLRGPPVPSGASEQGTSGLNSPILTVVEYQNLASRQADAPLVAGLAIELVTDLGQFESIETRYLSAADAAAMPPQGDFVLSGIVRPDGDTVKYSSILTDLSRDAVVWDHTISEPVETAASADVLDIVSRELSLVLGSVRGPLHQAARATLTSRQLAEGEASLYLCRIAFELYRETGLGADAERAQQCLASLSEPGRQAPMALAMAASLTIDYASPAVTPLAVAEDRARIAVDYLHRALAAMPTSGFIWEQQARLLERQGEFQAALAAYGSSIQLNPASADALAAYARLTALQVSLVDAQSAAMDAVLLSPDPPPWYQGVPALLALQAGDVPEALRRATAYAQADRELGPVIAIMAGQAAGDASVVNRYLPEVLETASFRESGVLTRLGQRIANAALLGDIDTALRAAGVPEAALTQSF
jgi:tetratricopeptide (TPR) repeat protein/TolB-like protein